LRRWEELRPELDRRGIAIVAISNETPEEIRAGRAKHGARATLLADPKLALTDRFNLRNRNSLAPPKHGTMLRPLPIPTTFLVDAQGIVRWVDQSDDYQIRSDPARVMKAIERGLGH
jgi:peroxiredoxin